MICRAFPTILRSAFPIRQLSRSWSPLGHFFGTSRYDRQSFRWNQQYVRPLCLQLLVTDAGIRNLYVLQVLRRHSDRTEPWSTAAKPPRGVRTVELGESRYAPPYPYTCPLTHSTLKHQHCLILCNRHTCVQSKSILCSCRGCRTIGIILAGSCGPAPKSLRSQRHNHISLPSACLS